MDQQQVHILLELVSFTLCWLIGFREYQRYLDLRTPLSLGWAYAFFMAGFLDVIHGVIEASDASSGAVLWSWSVSRFVLIATIAWAVISAHRGVRYINHMALYMLMVAGILTSVPFLVDVSGWVQTDFVVTRPVDACLALAYFYVAFLCAHRRTVWVEAPEYFHSFFILGFSVHLIMALGSTAHLDGVFIASHGLKIAEYSWWVIMLGKDRKAAAEKHDGYISVIQDRAQNMGFEDEYKRLDQDFRRQWVNGTRRK